MTCFSLAHLNHPIESANKSLAFFPAPGVYEDISTDAPYIAHAYPEVVEILEFLRGAPERDFEALVTRYPEFSWNELYLEVSRLNRHGLVKITRGVGIFTIQETPALP